jgi:hypothetical protein
VAFCSRRAQHFAVREEGSKATTGNYATVAAQGFGSPNPALRVRYLRQYLKITLLFGEVRFCGHSPPASDKTGD